jgi:hypothetical protein
MKALMAERNEPVALLNPDGESNQLVRQNPPRIEIKPDDCGRGLGKLVLTLVELIRELLERQAIRRIESGTLAEAEVERLGVTFMQLAGQIQVLKKAFGLDGEDLNIDLGPIGKLL